MFRFYYYWYWSSRLFSLLNALRKLFIISCVKKLFLVVLLFSFSGSRITKFDSGDPCS